MQMRPTGTVTFLFTDIEGSTKLWEQNADAMRPALARHDQILRDAIAQSEGFVFKTIGDAFCAAFETAPAALQSALAAQLALAAEPWPTETPINVRMALHTGSAEERGGDYFGPPLNRVARLMSAGHGGQTLVSLAARKLLGDALPPEAALRDLGERRLKDLSRPETVFQLLHPALPDEFPPLKSLDNPALPNNLPLQLTSFIGRETQAAEVKALLGKSRLLTLAGAGGSGKTRLSLQVAADLLDQYFDGVWLVELASLSDPALVPQAVANVLGVKEQSGQTLQQSLADALKEKRLLLVLDNCEHLIAACASLAADLLRSCPQVRIMASSRELLNVPGEQVYRVPSLSLPNMKQAQTALSVSQCEAVALFADRARAVQPSFVISDANAPAVASVCARLDGIPLAIELASARVRSLSVEQIDARLDRRFRLLTGGSRVALPRQQTLRALIDWSYDLLTGPEKTLLRRLSVFAGGWTLEAAESVCAGEPVEDWEVLDLLTALTDKSLTIADTEGDTARYRLLETVRQYGEDRLGESGETEAVRGRAAAYFLALAEEAEPQLTGPEQGAWLSRSEADHDNLRASLSWCEHQPEGTERGLRLAGSLWWFWSVRGHLSEGRQWLSRVLAHTGGSSRMRAEALLGAGALAYSQAEYVSAWDLLEDSLTLYRQLKDQRGIVNALNNMGNVAQAQAKYASARVLYEEVLTLSRQLNDQRLIANTLNNLGNSVWYLGECALSLAFYKEGLVLFRQLGNKVGIAYALNNLGIGACAQGEYALARDMLSESLTIFVQLGHRIGIAHDLEELAVVALGLRQPSRVVQLLGEADALRRATGSGRPSSEQEAVDKHLAAARVALGEDAFSEAWEAGRAMTMDAAVAYALEGKTE